MFLGRFRFDRLWPRVRGPTFWPTLYSEKKFSVFYRNSSYKTPLLTGINVERSTGNVLCLDSVRPIIIEFLSFYHFCHFIHVAENASSH